MGIIQTKAVWSKHKRRKKDPYKAERAAKRSKPASKSSAKSGGLRLERNSDGVRQFGQPKALNDFTTWSIYPSGEAILRRAGVSEGQVLPDGMFKTLRDGNHLYTKTGKPRPSSGAGSAARPPQAA